MSGNQAHRFSVPPDYRDVSGEEVWARRSSLPPIAPWRLQTMKTEKNVSQDALSMQFLSSPNPVGEGNTSETQPLSYQRQTSEAHSFLYSIPQYQAPSKQPTSQHPVKRPTPPVPAKGGRPQSALLQGLPPPTLVSIRPNQPSFIQPKRVQPTVPPKQLSRSERLPGIYRKDVLDGTIGIHPRNKESNELKQLKGSRSSYGEKGSGLPRSMEIVIQQFMVANGYICPYRHIPVVERPAFRNSLLLRLDLNNTFMITKETANEQRLIKSAWTSIDGYVLEKSREWKAQGVFEQASETAQPSFAAFTKGWINRKWDGNTRDFTRTTIMTTVSPVVSVSDDPDIGRLGQKDTDSVNVRQASRQIALGDDTGSSDNAGATLDASPKPTLKRWSKDSQYTQTHKRARTRHYAPSTDKHEYVDLVDNEEKSLDFTRPEEKSVAKLIEAIHHAQATMLDIVPMSAKDLIIMQQDWKSHGFPTMLADTLRIGQAYTAMMGKYFDNALDLLSLLKKSDHWKAGDKKVQMDCACQEGGSVPERLQNGGLPDPSIHLSSYVDQQHLHERENSTPGQSQVGKVSNEPMPSAGDMEVDCSFLPE